MKISMRRYSFLLFVQFSFLLADLFFNTFAQFLLREKLQLGILMFVTQDTFIVCEYLFFTYAVHSTCVYEVGGSHVILRNCKFFLTVITVYFLLSSVQHFLIVYGAVYESALNWPGILTAVNFFQRFVSFIYYYAYKRIALTMSDPRYDDENIDWIAHQLSNK